jgi:hypothetical protein|tara:strand:- start:273 stop:716 length:444 start_codon:yes stop_codon:yes gene_type:complete
MIKNNSVVVVDIDGTIAKVGERLKYLKTTPPDYDKFYASCFEDEPIIEMVDLVKRLQSFYKIVFCTGRREQVRDVTETWLCKNGLFGDLLMRPNKDHRHDTKVKPEQLSNSGVLLQEIAFVLEDRDSMVKKWRSLGLRCLQVDYADF